MAWPHLRLSTGLALFCMLFLLIANPAPLDASPQPNNQLAASANPLLQVKSSRFAPPLIVPLDTTTVELLTHTADFTFSVDAAPATPAAVTLTLDATYRLENSAQTPTVLTLKIAEVMGARGRPAEVALTADGVPLTFFRTEGVGYTAQLQINADTRTTVNLRHTLDLADLPLPLLAYHAAELNSWPGNPSLRVSITMPATISPESWLHIAPEQWLYAQVDNSNFAGIKWLYDARVPAEPFLFEFIHPQQWAELQQLATATATDPGAHLTLGNRYRALLDATPPTADYATVRERFYAQALAAYAAGLEAQPMGDRAGLFSAALAALYRIQVAQPNGTANASYAAAMVTAAQDALILLPTDHPQRSEITQWVADGLQIALRDARQNEAWATALEIVEQLSALPPAFTDPDMLRQAKREITVRQALQLLEAENRAGAVALAGDEVQNVALLPPAEQLPLFQRWEISATVTPEQLTLQLQPIVLPERAPAAQQAMSALVRALQSAATADVAVQWSSAAGASTVDARGETAEAPTGVQWPPLLIEAPLNSSFASLTTAIPLNANWTLLHTLLNQWQPTVERQAALLNQETALRLPLDLQPVHERWMAVAADLEAAAVAFEAAARAENTRDAAAAEQALQLRIQASNYRASAQEWQKVGRDSWLAVRFVIPAGLQAADQSWLLTTSSPATVLTLQSTPTYTAALMGTLALGVTVLLFLSGLLWWLL